MIFDPVWLMFAIPGLLLGLYAQNQPMFSRFIGVAIALFSIVTLFQVITLPVEFDASRRAKEQLVRLGIVRSHESGAVGQVLSAAALTYVAGMVSAILQLLYLFSLARDRR